MDIEDHKLLGNFGKSYWWFLGKRNLIDCLLSEIPRKRKRLKILDIGCGTGEDLPLISKYGDVFALEYSKEVIKYIPKEKVVGIVRGDARFLSFKENVFDIIIILDVLEHVKEDVKIMKEVSRVLKLDGILLISVPAVPFLFGNHDRALHHLRRYSKKSLNKILKDSGLKAERITYWNFFLFFPIAFVRILNKIKNVEKKSDIKNLPKAFNWFFLLILNLENKLIKFGINLPIGLSLVVILKKR
ncbi:MAG: class I SAM-dependent methyltransferase [Nanoarchaeota archaeon]|nr:class I SAM-dependent methyltransferase [Nanoarchaeota archaeon]